MNRTLRFTLVTAALAAVLLLVVRRLVAQDKPPVVGQQYGPDLEAILNWSQVIGVVATGRHQSDFNRVAAEFTFLPEEDGCEIEVKIPTGSAMFKLAKTGAIQKRGEQLLIWRENAPK